MDKRGRKKRGERGGRGRKREGEGEREES